MTATADIVTTGRKETMQENEEYAFFERVYRIQYAIFQDEDGAYNAVSLNIPGIATCANNEADVMNRFHEVANGVMEYYMKDAGEVPVGKKGKVDLPANAKVRYITIYG